MSVGVSELMLYLNRERTFQAFALFHTKNDRLLWTEISVRIKRRSFKFKSAESIDLGEHLNNFPVNLKEVEPRTLRSVFT